jgi:putative salt-induced outer membrane protein YdiY
MTMPPHRPGHKRALCLGLWTAGWLALGLQGLRAETVVLHLRNGDHLTGSVLSEDTNQVVLATSWAKELRVPQTAIARREAVTNAASPASVATVKTATATNVTETAKPAPATVAAAPPAKATAAKKPKRWKGNLTLGTDAQFGARDRQLYYGRLKVTYEQPYKSDPKKFFRNVFDYSVDYGKTDGVKSADRMYGSVKTDFDVGKRVYLYNLAGAGYDDIRKIDLEYEAGPGAGYHLFTRPNFVMNVESGANYQAQQRSDSPNVETFYFRLAEDLTWKINPRMTLAEKAEFFPRVERLEEFRARLDASLSLAVWQSLALKLSVLDLYDTNPAHGVNRNEVQVRSSLEITF